MFVKSMFADEWRDRADHGVEIPNPTCEQIEQAILQLDATNKTSVFLSDKPQSESYMAISGPWNGRYMVNVTIDNCDFFSLLDSSASTNKVLVFVGGQDGDFEERRFVPLEWALEAARCYYETGERKPTMNWVSDY